MATYRPDYPWLRVESYESVPSVAAILSALSHALDLVEGQPRGHATRTAYIADRIAERVGLDDEARDAITYASLLKDCGCSNNSARIHKMFGGDDLITKNRVKLIDWSSPVESVKFAFENMQPGGTVVQKLRKMVLTLGSPDSTMEELTRARCTRGSEIAAGLGFSQAVSDAIRNIDEHWDGRGAPNRLAGDQIPIHSRIIGLAQTLEVFVTAYGTKAGYDMMELRAAKWFDPELVRAVHRLRGDVDFWSLHAEHVVAPEVPLWSEYGQAQATVANVDAICMAFAEIVDAKSDFTGLHSKRVCDLALEMGTYFGFEPERLATLRRAALLHDIGKLGVSNAILDKPGPLTDEEFTEIKKHPRYSFEILNQVNGFDRISEIAGAHHERLNGNGYWRGLSDKEIDLDMRILAVADVYDALSAERPYRKSLPLEQVLDILEQETQRGLDPACVEAMIFLREGSPASMVA